MNDRQTNRTSALVPIASVVATGSVGHSHTIRSSSVQHKASKADDGPRMETETFFFLSAAKKARRLDQLRGYLQWCQRILHSVRMSAKICSGLCKLCMMRT